MALTLSAAPRLPSSLLARWLGSGGFPVHRTLDNSYSELTDAPPSFSPPCNEPLTVTMAF